MKKNMTLFIVFFLTMNTLHGQNIITGSVLNEESNLPIEYVNIGVIGKNIGTVSDENGKFNLSIEAQHLNDSLLFSRIGFEPLYIKILDFKENALIKLKEKVYSFNEVIVTAQKFKKQQFGITTESNLYRGGFINNNLGYECGLLMKNKKKAVVKKINVNILLCEYDTIFYRLNIYEERKKNDFENILTEPIYVAALKEDLLNGSLQIDLTERNIIVNGSFLVTLEFIKDLGDGGLLFPLSLEQRTYFRKTSQGNWETSPWGISLSVIANVEK